MVHVVLSDCAAEIARQGIADQGLGCLRSEAAVTPEPKGMSELRQES